MKNFLFVPVLFLTLLSVNGQRRSGTGQQNITINPYSGYANANEFTYGYGVAGTTMDYSEQYYGFTTSHGYQLNIYGLNRSNHLFLGLGTGVLFYKEGNLVPLFADFRYTWDKKKIEPFIFGASGVLFGVKNLDENTKLFINGGGGIRYSIDESFALILGAGYLIQMGTSRASFLNVKAGVAFKGNKY